MKKAIITLAIVLGMTLGASAQFGGGLFQRGAVGDEEYYGASYDYQTRTHGLLNLPSAHGVDTDQYGAPLGGGALLLIGFGAAYAVKKQRNNRQEKH